MRLKFSAMVFGVVICGAFPSLAQTDQTDIPLYNTTGTQYYSATQGGAPVYNNTNAPTLPMEQMVAGKNAPSYNYNQTTTQPYMFGATTANGTSQAAMTPQEVEAQYQAQLQAQQAYLNSIAQQQQNGNSGLLTGGPFGSTPVGDAGASGQTQKERRVVYREMNSPLSAPPRLFNPDQ